MQNLLYRRPRPRKVPRRSLESDCMHNATPEGAQSRGWVSGRYPLDPPDRQADSPYAYAPRYLWPYVEIKHWMIHVIFPPLTRHTPCWVRRSLCSFASRMAEQRNSRSMTGSPQRCLWPRSAHETQSTFGLSPRDTVDLCSLLGQCIRRLNSVSRKLRGTTLCDI